MTRGQHDVVAARRHLHVHQLVAFLHLDGLDAVRARIAVLRQRRLLDRAFPRAEEQEFGVAELAGEHDGPDTRVGRDVDEIDDRLTARIAAGLRQLVHLEPEATAVIGEDEHVRVRARHVKALDEVVFLEIRAGLAAPAPTLAIVQRQRRTLDVAVVRDGHDHLLFGDQIFDRELALVTHDFRAAFVAVGFHQLEQVALHDVHASRARLEDAAHLDDERAHFGELLFEFVALEAGELGETHVENRFRLPLREPEARLQLQARRGRVVGRADQPDHLVDVVDRDLEAFEKVLAIERLVEIELRTPHDHFVTMHDVMLEALLEREHLRHQLPGVHVGHQRQHDHAEGALHAGVLVQLIQHHARNGVALEADDDPDTIAVGLVPQFADAGELLIAHQLGDVDHELARIRLIRHFRHDDLRTPARLLLFDDRLRAHHDAAAARVLIVGDAGATVDVTAGREVGAAHDRPQGRTVEFRVVDHGDHGGHDFTQIVRRNVRGHAHRDTRRAVHQQVRNARWQHARLFETVVEVRREVDRILVDIGEHLDRHARESRLGVSIRGRVVAFHGAEVALAVHQRIAQRERLHHTHECVVHAAVAVRVVLAQHVADHRRRLFERTPRQQSELVHRVQHAAMHRLEAIAHVGQCPRYDDAHGIVDERFLDLLIDKARQDAFAGVRCSHVTSGRRDVVRDFDRQPSNIHDHRRKNNAIRLA